ncbi:MAG: serine/threonine protein kinase [Labilithrix sp.]|nr:serine/threonine protein kinase [Labilithrix sp.]
MSSDDQRTATFVPAPASDERIEPRPDVARGSARYAVERVLGEGGMGIVRLVHDEVVGRRVAKKELKRRDDEGARARFIREARLQGQLEHPAIPPVYDIGEEADGNPFFTMKRVRGQSLAAVIAQRKEGKAVEHSTRKLLAAFSQLCLATHYAHERGAVHRDIKPSNIMLGPYGEVYLLDWGVAKLEGEREPLASDESIDASSEIETARGAIVGTPATMAPEQASGARVDARADVYALGAVLFELLTLEPLHPRGTFEEIVPEVVRGVEARPSVRAPHMDVPPELERVCVAATRPDPADRLASAKDLHRRIEAYLDGDRDLALRREASARHADAAKRSADDARSTSASATRASALREVGRALALDPENQDALATLVTLLTKPPKEVPAEVRDEQLALRKRQIRIGGVAAALVYGYILLDTLWVWRFGIYDVSTRSLPNVFWSAAVLSALATIARPSYVSLFVTYLLGLGTSVFLTHNHGPYLIVPMLITLHVVLYSFVRSWRMRMLMVGVAAIGWTIAVYGARLGLFPESVEFFAGGVTIRAPALGTLHPEAMTRYLHALGLASVLGPPLVIGFLRRVADTADEAMRVQSWQLRQLVPGADTDLAKKKT